MKRKISVFNNFFNCPICNKTLWWFKILPDGKSVCNSCYEEIMKVEYEKIKQKQAYINSASRDLIDKGLSDMIFNFFEKKYNINPHNEELSKLWKILKIKYDVDIEYYDFFEVISKVYGFVKEKNDLKSFEEDLLPKKNPIDDKGYYCIVCKSCIDKKTYDYSNKYFNKALCLNHQGTKYHRSLFFALKRRGIPCEFEAFDGYKHVDIAIHDIKLYIEVDGSQHSIDSNQFLADLKRDRFSKEDGYQTRHFSNELINKHLEEIADTLLDVYSKFEYTEEVMS